MARYVPKHRRAATFAERRRSLAVAAIAVSGILGLSGSYGFVPGTLSAAPNEAAAVSQRRTADTPVSGLRAAAQPNVAAGKQQSVVPSFLDIERIGATSSLIPLSLRDDGSLAVPEVASQAGWWSQGAVPGQEGAAVIVGHVDSYLGPAVFARLDELKPGDSVRVATTDGSVLRFAVQRVDQYPKDAFPSDLVYASTNKSELRLITCGGTFDRSARSYRDNVVVYATRV